ncbi:MAG: Rne/Rng family ribonuclease [Gammaproteobacteria bacterium]
MLDEMLVNINPYECRVALLLNEKVQEIYVERAGSRSLVGNIYKGKVTRVLPGMQAAFVEIGLERSGFLHVGNIAPLSENDEIPMPALGVDIRHYVHQGQEIVVQVSRDPLGTKGARLSAHLSFSSRYLVYMPSLTKDFLSKRIMHHSDRQRLFSLLDNARATVPQVGGFVVRTQAIGQTDLSFQEHMEYLHEVWERIREKIKHAKVGECCYEELPLPLRIWRDRLSTSAHVKIDDKAMYHRTQDYVERFFPDAIDDVNYYDSHKPIFDLYGVEQDITSALKPSCSLPSGGYLLIEQTEAMATIDVNTGGFVGKESLNETFLKTNLEAVEVIARQLRLRNLGGIIVLDFIDMEEESHREQVRQALLHATAHDVAKITINDFSGLGLIEMTRQRMRESLEHILCEECHQCKGSGSVKRLEMICMDIVREIKRKFTPFEDYSFTVVASPMVVEHCLSANDMIKETLKNILTEDIIFQTDAMYPNEKFDVLMT